MAEHRITKPLLLKAFGYCRKYKKSSGAFLQMKMGWGQALAEGVSDYLKANWDALNKEYVEKHELAAGNGEC